MILDGNKLFNEIAKRGVTITEFANHAQLPPATIHRAIKGANVNARTIGKIAATLQVEPTELRMTIETPRRF